MAAEKQSAFLREETGQSVIEFLIMLPLMIGIVVLMVRVNSAIQVSIVNQQYAAAHTHWLTFNSPVYPQKAYLPRLSNQMVIGVSSNTNSSPSEIEYEPETTVSKIARDSTRAVRSPKEDPTEPLERTDVRVRTTVALCTQSNAMNTGTVAPLSLDGIKDARVFAYCLSPLEGAR